MTEIGWRAIHSPRSATAFVGADKKALAFLAHIVFAIIIMDQRKLSAKCLDLRNIVGNKILMFHRHQRKIQTSKFSNFPAPKSCAVHQVSTFNLPFGRIHGPTAILLLCSCYNRMISVNRCTIFSRTRSIGVSYTAWIDMRFIRFVHGTQDTVKIDQWIQFTYIVQ